MDAELTAQLEAIATAYAQGDYASARRGLAALPADAQLPAAEAALLAQIRTGLRLDPAIIVTGLAFLGLWAALFFASVG